MESDSPRIRVRLRALKLRYVASLASCALELAACDTAACMDGLVEFEGECIEPMCDEPCGTNEFCDVSVTPAACACSPGFSGIPCTFSGLIQDPGFMEPSATGPWQGTQGATVLNQDPGDGDLGMGVLQPDVVCNAGRLLQEVEMPSVEGSVPFVAEINYRTEGVRGLALGFDSAWTRVAPNSNSAAPERVCLGEGAYGPAPGGGPISVQLSASERLADCVNGDEPQGRISVTRFSIVPASTDECPTPGTVANGTGDPDGTPWRFLTDGNEDDVSASLEQGVGREGTAAARLSRAAGVEGRATMSTRVSVPRSSTLESPALRFWWRATDRQTFNVNAGTLVGLDDRGRQLDTLVGTINTNIVDNAGRNRLYCLPPWTHGTVIDLAFSLPDAPTTERVELVIDDIAVTSDTRCGESDLVFDGSFESAPTSWFGATVSSADEAVFVQDDAAQARTGGGVLELTYWTDAPRVAIETYVRIPEDDSRPALTFFSRSPFAPSVSVSSLLGRSEFVTAPIRTTDTWQRNEVCLPAEWAGRWFRVLIRAGSGPGPGTANAIPQERVFLDDFALESCSTE